MFTWSSLSAKIAQRVSLWCNDAFFALGFSQQLALDFLFPEDHTNHRLRERMCMNPFISDGNQWLAVKKGQY